VVLAKTSPRKALLATAVTRAKQLVMLIG